MINRRTVAAYLLFGAVGSAWGNVYGQTAKPVSAAAELDAFYAAEWEYNLKLHPETATYVGDGRFNDRLSDYSPEEMAREAAHDAAALARLKAIPTTGLDESQTISREMMLRQLTASVEGYRLKEWEMPVSQMNGVHLDLAALYSQMPFNDAKDYRNYIARLKQVPRVFEQETAVMRLGMRDHLMQPRYLLEKVAVQASGIASTPAEKSPFATPLEHFPDAVNAADRAAIRAELLSAITQRVLPAYAKFAIFVRDTYAPAGRTEDGIWALPNGEELYRNAIHEHVQTTMDANAIFAEGMREVTGIEAQMLALAKTLGYNDLTSFHAAIQADPKLHAASGEQILGLYRKYEDQMVAKLPQVVAVPPALPLDVVPMDSFRAPNAVPADYSPGSSASGRPGRVNVNLYNPTSRLLLNVEAIAYHEGLPDIICSSLSPTA